jgi:cell pole-organizing protein PopZ
MEEILASIRRIIADEPAKPSRSDAQRSDALRPGIPRSDNLRDEAIQSASTNDLDGMLARLSAESLQAPPAAASADLPPLTEQITPALPEPSISDDREVLEYEHGFAASNTAHQPPVEPPRAAERQEEEEEPEQARIPHPGIAVAREVRRGDAEPGLISPATSAAMDSAFNTLAQTVLVQNARTLEDLVREMLRPLLKTWLDDNLPALVERLVRAEIERVSRGRG